MEPHTKKPNPNKINLMVDIVLFSVFLVAMSPRFSGLAIHEWLSIAFGGAIVLHLLLHWQWIIEISKRLLGNAPGMSRLNYLLNGLLFIAMTIVMLSGIVISEIVLPSFGVEWVGAGVWRRVHTVSADVSLVLVGVHIAFHWQWIVNALKRYLLTPFLRKPQPSPVSMQQERQS
jgi:hypothetical protein